MRDLSTTYNPFRRKYIQRFNFGYGSIRLFKNVREDKKVQPEYDLHDIPEPVLPGFVVEQPLPPGRLPLLYTRQ